MSYIYIQQNTALGESIPYPSSAHPNATIATSGCGVCASLMALRNLTNYKVSLKSWTKELIAANCRADEGTDMQRVCAYMKQKYGIAYAKTADIEQLVRWMQKGYGAIANVGARGYFSSAGHFVYVAGITGSQTLIVLDPYYYDDKYTATVNGIDRSKYLRYDAATHELFCKPKVLEADRGGYYYLLKPTKKAKKAVKQAAATYTSGTYKLLYDMIVRTGAGTNYKPKRVRDLTADGKKHATSKNPAAEAVLKAGTRVDAAVIKKGSDIWLQIPSGYVCLKLGSKIYAKRVK